MIDVKEIQCSSFLNAWYILKTFFIYFRPLASMFDPASPNCCLRLMPTEKFDESGKRFIEDKLKSSTLFKMAVLGLDVDNCLHIRLYFNQGSSYICLNDMLCDLKHADHISHTNIAAKLQPLDPKLSLEKLPFFFF